MTHRTKVLFKRLDKGIIPTKAHSGDAGWDTYSTISVRVPVHQRRLIPLGFQVAIPEGYVGLLFGRSGLGVKSGVRPSNCVGVIDSGYRGEVCVSLVNDGSEAFQIERGYRVAQLVVLPILQESEEVETLPLLNDGRDGGGFGSSGS